jgi:hypothetical protein
MRPSRFLIPRGSPALNPWGQSWTRPVPSKQVYEREGFVERGGREQNPRNHHGG